MKGEDTGKSKISYDEYKTLARMIVALMKKMESEGKDNVQQKDVVDQVVRQIELKNEGRGTSLDASLEQSKKVQKVIQHLIQKENLLVVTNEAKVRNDRYLSLDINVNIERMGEQLQGSTAPVFD